MGFDILHLSFHQVVCGVHPESETSAIPCLALQWDLRLDPLRKSPDQFFIFAGEIHLFVGIFLEIIEPYRDLIPLMNSDISRRINAVTA